MKKTNFGKTALRSLALCAIGFFALGQGSALPVADPDVPWLSYTYGVWDSSVPASPIYEPIKSVNGFDLGIGALNSPDDMCKDPQGNICILDKGNHRIVKVDSNFNLVEVIQFEQGVDKDLEESLVDEEEDIFAGIYDDQYGDEYDSDSDEEESDLFDFDNFDPFAPIEVGVPESEPEAVVEEDDGVIRLVDPQGIYYDNQGILYVADKGAECVYKIAPDGTLIQKIVKPVTDLLNEDDKFSPTKLLVDNQGILYVLSFGSFEGAYTFDENGDFLGFFGSNKVSVTSQLLSDRFWRLLATKAQRERMARYVPIEYVNFTIDKTGFIYTVSNFGEQESAGQVRKLNPLSQNILFYGQKPDLQFFGDPESTFSNRIERSSLVAIDVDEQGIISVLDFERGRIFQYDQDCHLLGIVGGSGSQVGTFTAPADIVSVGNRLFVLDSIKSSITSFELTDYGKAIHEATTLYDEGFFEEALDPYYEALKADRTNYIIHNGIGRAHERLENYEEAMDYYKQAESHKRYSDAFHEFRTVFLRKHFTVVMLIIIMLLLIPVWKWIYLKINPKKTGPIDHAVYIKKYKFPFYLCLHPFKGWEELKHEKQGSLWFANVMLVVWFLLTIVDYQYTGFIFNRNRLDRMNLLILFASSIGAFFLWCVCNWAVCTLFDGKGTFKEVWIFSAYSRMTWILMEIPIIILSNFVVREEGFWLNLLMYVQQGLSILQMVLAVKAAHQYSMKKTIGSIALTLLGMLLVVLIVLLFVSLFTQMWSFCQTIFQEILMRL